TGNCQTEAGFEIYFQTGIGRGQTGIDVKMSDENWELSSGN
ncbi:hypothetical protein A2U01_0058391, partial [Trifolium medium]|nr:hypothetical protein [Trifolium medium]